MDFPVCGPYQPKGRSLNLGQGLIQQQGFDETLVEQNTVQFPMYFLRGLPLEIIRP